MLPHHALLVAVTLEHPNTDPPTFFCPSAWLEQGCLRQLVLVITEADTKEVLERWTFDIDTNKEALAKAG